MLISSKLVWKRQNHVWLGSFISVPKSCKPLTFQVASRPGKPMCHFDLHCDLNLTSELQHPQPYLLTFFSSRIMSQKPSAFSNVLIWQLNLNQFNFYFQIINWFYIIKSLLQSLYLWMTFTWETFKLFHRILSPLTYIP